WTNLLDMIKSPVKVWDVPYKPLGLGEYPDIQSLWGVWEEGRCIDGIRRSVPLRLIEEKWGNLKNENGKGTFPVWRPRNETSARKTWSNFSFFINEVEKRRRQGKSTQQAIEELEQLRNGKSLNQLYKSLRPKKGSK
ncbi:hypothetical protein K435DRAFT_559462, partial [Dendrothele bispora CBS 962.96]